MVNSKLAAPELATVEVHGITRGAFIMRAALAAGSVYGLHTVAPFVSEALAQDKAGDIEILNFALTLEFLETDFYRSAQGLSGEAAALARTLATRRPSTSLPSRRRSKGSGARLRRSPKRPFPRAGRRPSSSSRRLWRTLG